MIYFIYDCCESYGIVQIARWVSVVDDCCESYGIVQIARWVSVVDIFSMLIINQRVENVALI